MLWLCRLWNRLLQSISYDMSLIKYTSSINMLWYVIYVIDFFNQYAMICHLCNRLLQSICYDYVINEIDFRLIRKPDLKENLAMIYNILKFYWDIQFKMPPIVNIDVSWWNYKHLSTLKYSWRTCKQII